MWVTPCVGVWIEILYYLHSLLLHCVTPCVGVWIEIFRDAPGSSHVFVTPCVGVWIEIDLYTAKHNTGPRHSLLSNKVQDANMKEQVEP